MGQSTDLGLLSDCPTIHAFDSCQSSLLWGDLVWLSRTGIEEDDDDSDAEEVRGGFALTSLPASMHPAASDLLSLSRNTGPTCWRPDLPPTAFPLPLAWATRQGLGGFNFEYNKTFELRGPAL